MFYGSDEFNSAIENTHGNAPKIRVTLEDGTTLANIKSIKYYGGSNDSDDVSIGTTNMARIDVTAFTDRLLTSNEIFLEQGIELANGVVEYMPIGYFTVQKPQGDIDEVTFTAYDRMQKFEKPYSSNLAYPTTSALILNELCQICGIELATTLDNAIEVTENLKGYTCREVLGYIASMHGYFACIDRYGRLNLRWYSDTPIEKSLKKIWHFEKSQENFEIAKVDIAKNSETNYVSGDGITTLHNSNPLATQEITDGIFAKLGGFNYSVGEIEMLDDARLDPWDMVSIEYYDGKTYNIPCMALEHDFKAYSTTVKSVGKSESENEYRFTGPTIQYLNRMATDLLVANRVIATKVDAEYVNSVAITTENFDAKVAKIKELIVEEIDGKYANIDLANIDIANINVGKIGGLFAKVGLIDRATIVEGHITGFLDAVEVNANKITAGTLIADRILLSGEEGSVLYALNNLGELTSTNVDTLDGYVLTDRTINADKLIANSITANELDVNQIFGNEAVLNKIVSQEIFTDAIETNRIIVGASENANKALQEVNKTVKSITMHYLATTLASGVTTATSGWTTTVQQIDATKKYLWTYQTITYVDNTTTDTNPVISGVYGNEGKDGKDGADGKDGIDGTNGTDGTDGVSVTSVIPLYYLKSNTTAPSAPTSAVTSTAVSSGVWTKSVPTYVNGYTYFTCTQTQYANGTYSWSTVVADNALTNANKTATTANATANTANTNASNAVTTANGLTTRLNNQSSNLVINGFGEYRDATNWSGVVSAVVFYDGEDYPDGCFGSFIFLGAAYTNQLIPYNPTEDYLLSATMKSYNGQDAVGCYFSIEPYDADGNKISYGHTNWMPDTTTTLAQDLKKGDTVIHFVSLTNWANTTQTYQRGFLFWNYKDSKGKTYEKETYSRSLYWDRYTDDNSVNRTSHTITLKSAWTGETIPAGTYVSQSTDGGGYIYPLGDQVSGEWKDYQMILKSSSDRRLLYAKSLRFCTVFTGSTTMKIAKLYFGKDTVNSTELGIVQNSATVANNAAAAAQSTANSANTLAGTANSTANSALNRATYHYGTCATAAATVAKVVTLSGFTLYTGAQITVQFTYANTAANPTLNVNGTGAKYIRVNNANITSAYYWKANNTVTFIYDGTYWTMADSSANSLVASWCSANDVTLIDGGKIYTGSITADKIDVDDLFAEDITATGTIRGAILKSINYDEDTGVGMLLNLNNATIESRGEDFVTIFNSEGHYGGYTQTAQQGIFFAPDFDTLTGQPSLSISNGQLKLNNVSYNSYGINYGNFDILNWTTEGIATPKLSTDLIYCNGEMVAKTVKADNIQTATYSLNTMGAMAVRNKQDIATINSNLNKSMFGTSVDISSYTQSNPYIAPSDGYLRPNSWSNVARPYYINGLDGVSPANTSVFIFVKKGFKLWGNGHIDGTNLGFYPLI